MGVGDTFLFQQKKQIIRRLERKLKARKRCHLVLLIVSLALLLRGRMIIVRAWRLTLGFALNDSKARPSPSLRLTKTRFNLKTTFGLRGPGQLPNNLGKIAITWAQFLRLVVGFKNSSLFHLPRLSDGVTALSTQKNEMMDSLNKKWCLFFSLTLVRLWSTSLLIQVPTIETPNVNSGTCQIYENKT